MIADIFKDMYLIGIFTVKYKIKIFKRLIKKIKLLFFFFQNPFINSKKKKNLKFTSYLSWIKFKLVKPIY
jgi:hypothetical protein